MNIASFAIKKNIFLQNKYTGSRVSLDDIGILLRTRVPLVMTLDTRYHSWVSFLLI